MMSDINLSTNLMKDYKESPNANEEINIEVLTYGNWTD